MSREDWQAWLAKGLPAYAAELRRRIRAFDPPDEFSMDHVRVDLPGGWHVYSRLQMPSYFIDRLRLEVHETRAEWRGVDFFLARFSGELLAVFEVREIFLFVSEVYRSKADQDLAVARGNSRTSWPVAAHPQGVAVDIVHGRYGWDMTCFEWEAVGHVGKMVWAKLAAGLPPDRRPKCVWGGDWRSLWDPAHWEIGGWRSDLRPPSLLLELEGKRSVRLTRAQLKRWPVYSLLDRSIRALGDATQIAASRGERLVHTSPRPAQRGGGVRGEGCNPFPRPLRRQQGLPFWSPCVLVGGGGVTCVADVTLASFELRSGEGAVAVRSVIHGTAARRAGG